jgi:hypothetical protein
MLTATNRRETALVQALHIARQAVAATLPDAANPRFRRLTIDTLDALYRLEAVTPELLDLLTDLSADSKRPEIALKARACLAHLVP